MSPASGTKVYLDTNIVIYAVEGFVPLQRAVEHLFARIEAGEIAAATSTLTLAEVLVKPFRAARYDLVELYREFLEGAAWIASVPISTSTLVMAAEMRAGSGLTLADAIHVASAVEAGCSVFVTNDRRLALPASLTQVPIASLDPGTGPST